MEYMLVSTKNTIFFNPEIPGLGLCQSRVSGLRKTSGIPGFGIPGLQSLMTNDYSKLSFLKMQFIALEAYCRH